MQETLLSFGLLPNSRASDTGIYIFRKKITWHYMDQVRPLLSQGLAQVVDLANEWTVFQNTELEHVSKARESQLRGFYCYIG